MKIGTISDLIAYRRRYDNLVRETDTREVTSVFGGEWTMRIFTEETEGTEHVALVKGDITTPEPVLVRTHALDPMADLLGIGIDRPDMLGRAMRIIAAEGRGVVCLFREPQPKLHRSDEEGPRIVKHTGLGAQILSNLGLRDLILLTNSPSTRYVGLDAYGLRIAGTRPITE